MFSSSLYVLHICKALLNYATVKPCVNTLSIEYNYRYDKHNL